VDNCAPSAFGVGESPDEIYDGAVGNDIGKRVEATQVEDVRTDDGANLDTEAQRPVAEFPHPTDAGGDLGRTARRNDAGVGVGGNRLVTECMLAGVYVELRCRFGPHRRPLDAHCEVRTDVVERGG
jgi:hypothetical protein